VVDFERFAEPVTGDAPCGPDCEYEGDFLALSQAVAGKPEQQFGDTVIPAVPPDWRQVDSMAQDLLGRSKDLRVVAWFALANTYLHGAEHFAAGLKLVLTLCERFWDDVHPRVIVDGEHDPYLRMNAIAAFSGSEFSGEDRLIQALRASVLIKHPLTVTYRDVELGFTNSPDAPLSDAQLQSVLADAMAAGNESIAAVAAAFDTFNALRALLEDRVSAADMPDLDRLASVLKPVASGIARVQAQSGGVAALDDSNVAGGETGAGGSMPAMVAMSGVIQSRDDARRALEKVCEYLERHEPSNPASLFARRAQRMLNMQFLDIMRELSPDSMSHLEMLTGANVQQDSSNY